MPDHFDDLQLARFWLRPEELLDTIQDAQRTELTALPEGLEHFVNGIMCEADIQRRDEPTRARNHLALRRKRPLQA
jgi:hypothetical protein